MTPPDNGVIRKLHDHKIATLEGEVGDLRSVIRDELEVVRGEIANSHSEIRNLKNHEIRELQSDLSTMKVDLGELKGAASVGVWFLGLVALINVVIFIGLMLSR